MSEGYILELAGVVALPDRMQCSMVTLASRIKVAIHREQAEILPDNSLIALLCDCARMGYEYGEVAQHGEAELFKQIFEQRDHIATLEKQIEQYEENAVDNSQHIHFNREASE